MILVRTISCFLLKSCLADKSVESKDYLWGIKSLPGQAVVSNAGRGAYQHQAAVDHSRVGLRHRKLLALHVLMHMAVELSGISH